MSKTPSVKIVISLVAVVAATQTYRRNRRNQLALMPKGINTAAGVTMRSSIKAARPTTVGR